VVLAALFALVFTSSSTSAIHAGHATSSRRASRVCAGPRCAPRLALRWRGASRATPALRMSLASPEDDGFGGDEHLSADLDMEVLRRRIERSGAGTGCARADDMSFAIAGDELSAWDTDALHETLGECDLDDLDYGWVLLFHPGSEEEGVYTVQDDDSTTFVLAFQDRDDATRFAHQLEAENFDLPAVAEWDMDILTEFCEEGEYKIGLVPTGVMLMPPRHNYYRDDLLRLDGAEECDLQRIVEGSVCAEGEPSFSPLSGERASRVTDEVVARLDRLYAAADGHSPFDDDVWRLDSNDGGGVD